MRILIKAVFLGFLASSLLLSCGVYKMPEDDGLCVIPDANNPTMTGSRGGDRLLPKMDY